MNILQTTKREESTLKMSFKRADILAKSSITIVGAIAVAAISSYKDIKLSADILTSAAALSLILTLMSGFWLAMYTLCMSNHERLKIWQYILYVLLVSLNGLCLMCTNVMLLAIINHPYALLGLCVFLVPFVTAKLAYLGRQINSTDRRSSDRVLETTMKSCSDVANLTAPAAFSMQLAIILEYFNNPTQRNNPLPSVDLSVTFWASMAGILSMIVTAMPLEYSPPSVRPRLVLFVKFLRNSMLILTVAAATTLGGEFLDGLVLLALIPILMFGVVYMTVLLFTDQPVLPVRKNLNVVEIDIPTIFTSATTTCILLLSTAYALYTGGENVDVYFRVGILCLVTVIASSLSFIALVHKIGQWESIPQFFSGIFLGSQILITSIFLAKIFIDICHKL
jgi:hypothetical protein